MEDSLKCQIQSTPYTLGDISGDSHTSCYCLALNIQTFKRKILALSQELR